MGCGGSKEAGDYEEPVDAAGKAGSDAIERQLEAQQKEENKIVKLLVLGTGESGKSTVFKQMKILYSVPDPPSKFIMVVRANLFGNAAQVRDGMGKLGIEFKDPAASAAAEKIKDNGQDGSIKSDGLEKDFATMYGDAGVQEAIERAHEFQLNDSTRYFWERAAEILKTDYLPSEQDVLRARVRTTGIVQQNFVIKDQKYTMFDVGGQRNERRKWIHCFDNVTAVIFVTAISEFDQMLYEDANTNRMDEALTLFDQICNHQSFKETSMILFLNKRDLFEMKLKKKDLTCWDPSCPTGHDYDASIAYLKQKFLDKNKEPEKRQVYCHATCATDTSNISFVMDSVFDIILKENLRKMDAADVSKMTGTTKSTGKSAVKTEPTYAKGTIVLAAGYYVDNQKTGERKVMVQAGTKDTLPAVEVMSGFQIPFDCVKPDAAKEGSGGGASPEWAFVLGLGKDVPDIETPAAEKGTFNGNFKDAVRALRGKLGLAGGTPLGSVYDSVITTKKAGCQMVIAVRKLDASGECPAPGTAWVDIEEFESAAYLKYDGCSDPCPPPAKGEEFNPFAADPSKHRWFKGIMQFTACTLSLPSKGVYLGICKVVSTTEGFKIMVNEHNRIMIPTIFISESQLGTEEVNWLQGVRTRESKGVDLLEGKKPNLGWLGPEMSGEEGATFKEKLWWAIDEGKVRLGGGQTAVDSLGKLYDFELPLVDEQSNLQLILFATLAKDEKDILPGHIWVDRSFLELQNMKYMAPRTVQGMASEMQGMMNDYVMFKQAAETTDISQIEAQRKKINEKKAAIEKAMVEQGPLKWVNRVIMWCADKMPSVVPADVMSAESDAAAAVTKGQAAIPESYKTLKGKREAVLAKYMK